VFTVTAFVLLLCDFDTRYCNLNFQKKLKGLLSKFTVQLMPARSHNSNLVGDFKSIVVLGKDHVGFLFAARGDKSVDLADLDRVKLLDSLFDHWLGSALVNHKDEGVVIFNSLDSTLGGSWVSNDGVLVPGVLFGN